MKLLPVGFAVLFAVAHTQSPLYYSNQNQYFLHGAAQAGVGDLSSDWLANTADPTPAFSAFVKFCLTHLGAWPFHVVYFLALMAYFLSAWWLVKPGIFTGPVFAALFTLLHAGLLRWASDRLLGADYPWFFHCGLASQYILGAGLQPSVIGVALLASVAAYRDERPLLAVGLAAGANLIHSTYLLPAALLIAGYLVGEAVRGKWKKVTLGALLGIALVVPVVIHILTVFAPDSTCFDEAQRILSEVRIPHHTRPARWFDWVAGLQVLWMFAGLLMLRGRHNLGPHPVAAQPPSPSETVLCEDGGRGLKTHHPVSPSVPGSPLPPSPEVTVSEGEGLGVRAKLHPPERCVGTLFLPLRVTMGLALLGTVAVLVTENPTLSLMFPWRITAVLVPVATAMLVAKLADRVKRSMWQVSGGLLSVAVVGAVAVYLFHLGYREPEGEDAALEYVAEHHKPGEVYLVPARFPKPPTSRGVYSNTFTKPPDPSAVVYFEMARYRLRTGAALYVDFKAIPYKDTEVMEWHRRVSRCEAWFAEADWDRSGVVGQLVGEGITHVVAPTKLGLKSKRLEAIPLERGAYTVYRVR